MRSLKSFLCLLLLPLCTFAQSVWVDSKQEGDIVYLLRQSPAQIMRFDLSTETWMSSLVLTEIPQAFSIDASHIFISYGRKIERIDLDGSNKVHVANSSDDIRELLIDGNLLFANRTASLYARLTILDKTTFAQIDTAEDYVNGIVGASISPIHRKIFGRSIGYSPSDLNYMSYNPDGTFAGTGETPYHGDYPGASKTWVFPDESKVLDNSGTVYNTTDLTYANSFGMSIDDISFHGSDIPVVLVDDELIAYSNTLIETGRFQLGKSSEEIYIDSGTAYVFFETDSSATGVAVEVVPLSDFSVNAPGQPIDPTGLAYTVDGSAMDDSGILYLLSKAHNSIFRWDTNNLEYLDSIALPEAMDLVVFSPAQNCLYLSSASKRVYKIDLSISPLAAVHHLTTPLKINTLMPLEDDLFALINGSWDDQWIYASDGTLLNSNIDCCYHDFYFYHRSSSLLYFDNYTATYLHDGTFGTIDSHSYNSSFNPIALSPNGQLMIDGGGILYSASSFAQIDTLSNNILSAGWDTSGTLFTVKKPNVSNATSVTLQKWNELLSDTEEVTLPGDYIELYVNGNSVLLLVDEEGIPTPYLFDSSLDLQAPTTIEAPTLSVEKFSATAATLTWNDVYGEENYTIERKLDSDTNWQEIANLALGAHVYTDVTLTTGNIYQFRMLAVNDGTFSDYSNTVEVDLSAVVDNRVDPRTVDFTIDDLLISEDDMIYILSEAHESIFVWNAITQDWAPTIPLQGAPYAFTYANENNALYTHYNDGIIRSIDLSALNPVEIGFADFSNYRSMHGIIGAGEYVLVSVANSNWDDHYTLDAAGNIVHMAGSRYEIENGVWSSTNRSAYHFRDGTSPNDLIRTPVDASGIIGPDDDSPYHSSTGIRYPIRVAPDGTIVLLGSGRIYNALTLEHVNSLSSTIDDAIWLGGQLITLTSNRIYSHDNSTYGATLRLSPGNSIQRILARSDNELIVVSEGGNGRVTFDIYKGSDFTALPPANLAAPDPVSSQIANPTEVDLNWYDVSGETGYRIERRVNETGPWSSLGATGVGVTTFSDTSVSLSNTYEYRVFALNAQGESLASATSSVSLLPPTKPLNFSASVQSAFEIELSWEASDNTDSYQLERKLSSDSNWLFSETLSADTLSYTDSSLYPNTSYDYRIIASSGLGNSTYALQENIVTDYAPPTQTYFYHHNASAMSIYLAWEDADFEESYSIERRLSGNNLWEVVATFTSETWNWTDTDVLPETAYDYRVRALNSIYDGPYSATYQVVTPKLLPPDSPGSVSAQTLSASEIAVYWDSIPDATGYRLERTTDGTPSWTTLAQLPAGTTDYIDTNVEEFFEYFYRVIALNDAGESLPSATANATAYDVVPLIEDDFNNGYNPAVWASISGGEAINGGLGFRESPALWFGQAGVRYAQTIPVDLSYGGVLRFKLRDGNLPPNSSYWERSDSGEYLILEYSINGVDWFSIGNMEPNNPDSYGWSDFDLEVPANTLSQTTSFRIRQLSNSGTNYDTWGLEDFEILGRKPEIPQAPGYLVANENSASSIVLLWPGSTGATSYLLERFDPQAGWQLHAELPATQNYFTDTGLRAMTFYFYRVAASNAGGTSPYSMITTGRTYSQWQEWLSQYYGITEEVPQTSPTYQTADGSTNLVKYAFNLAPSEANITLDSQNHLRGTPIIEYRSDMGCLVVDMLRRKQSSNPGTSYEVLFSSDLVEWTNNSTVLSITSVDSTWERVVFKSNLPTDEAQFSKVVVRLDTSK